MARWGSPEGGEKENLVALLDRNRDAVLWKLEGLDEEQLRRAVLPSGTSLLGLVKHLGSVEQGWFCATFGRETEDLPDVATDPEADMRPEPGETAADVLAFHARSRALAGAAIAELGLTDTGTAWSGETVSLRWVLLHMITEVARHAGHADDVRELLDGSTGDHRR